ncbi:small GTPase superfamily [Mycena filopes]|nr:small GTPase superfamily [Mycena filopes]
MDTWTIRVLGEGGVGKTALAITGGSYDGDPAPGEYRRQFLLDNRMCFVEIIDTAGQEHMLGDESTEEDDAFILMYSITSRFTFDHLQTFHQTVKRIKKDEPILILVGNKCDLGVRREVPKAEGEALARQFGCAFMETSARSALNVERALFTLVRALRAARGPLAGVAPTAKKEKKTKCTIL